MKWREGRRYSLKRYRGTDVTGRFFDHAPTMRDHAPTMRWDNAPTKTTTQTLLCPAIVILWLDWYVKDAAREAELYWGELMAGSIVVRPCADRAFIMRQYLPTWVIHSKPLCPCLSSWLLEGVGSKCMLRDVRREALLG
jgi:hypothetical protein